MISIFLSNLFFSIVGFAYEIMEILTWESQPGVSASTPAVALSWCWSVDMANPCLIWRGHFHYNTNYKVC